MDSEIGRFPRLFRGKESIPGLTWPHIMFHKPMTLWMGKREVQIIHIGRAHTAGDTVVWLPKERVLFAGDTVEFGATPYCGDAHFTDWPATLDAIRGARAREAGAGPRPQPDQPARCRARASPAPPPLPRTCSRIAKRGAARRRDAETVYQEAMEAMRPKYGHWVIFEHCMPFDVSRAYDEAKGLDHPQHLDRRARFRDVEGARGRQPHEVRRSA